MALPTSGQITMNQVATELGVANAGINLNQANVRQLAGRASGTIGLNHLHGKGRATVSLASLSGSSSSSFRTATLTVSSGATTSGAWTSGGSSISVNRASNTTYHFSATGGTVSGNRSGTYRVTATPSGGGIAATVNISVSLRYTYVPPDPCGPGGCNQTCFPYGSFVLMADGSQKEITTIQSGDWVQGPTKPWQVDYLHIANLGKRRMLAFGDGSLAWSDEHLFWAKKDNHQWWWCADPEHWREEVDSGLVKGLYDNYSHFTDSDVLFAHKQDVWRARDVLDVTDIERCTPETKVYLPIPNQDSDHMCFVNGYLVTASTDQWTMDYTAFDWDKESRRFGK